MGALGLLDFAYVSFGAYLLAEAFAGEDFPLVAVIAAAALAAARSANLSTFVHALAPTQGVVLDEVFLPVVVPDIEGAAMTVG